MTPCGKIVDYLRSCYEADFRFFPDDLDRVSRVRWYRPAPGAKLLGFYNRFSSSVYSPPAEPVDDPQLGEIIGAPRVWNPGNDTLGLPGTYTCTDVVKWENGSPGPDADFDETACCTPPAVPRMYQGGSGAGRAQGSDSGLPTGAAHLAISYWGKRGELLTNGVAIGYGTHNPAHKGVHLGSTPPGTFGWYAGTDGGPVVFSGILDLNWHWLYQDYDGTNWNLYVDNVFKGSSAMADNITLSGVFSVGSYVDTTFTFTGNIDDVRVYNRQLTSTERAEIYNAGHGSFVAGSAGSALKRWFTFDNYTTGTITDLAGSGFPLTLAGAGTVVNGGVQF